MNNSTSETKSTGLNLKAFFFKALDYWYLFLIAIASAFAYGYYQVRYMVPIYAVNARVLVQDEYSSWGQEYFLPGMELVSSRNRLVNEVGIIRSFPIIKKTIDSLKSFDVFYFEHGNIKVQELYKACPFNVNITPSEREKLYGKRLFVKVLSNQQFELSSSEQFSASTRHNWDDSIVISGGSFSIGLESFWDGLTEKTFSFTFNDPNWLAKYYQKNTGITTEDKASSVLILSRSGPEIDKEIDFINMLIEVYIQSGLEESNQTASSTIKFVDSQINKILDSLITAEDKLQNFKSSANRNLIPLDQQDFITQVLDIEKVKATNQMNIEFYRYTLEFLEREKGSDREIMIPSIFTSSSPVNAQINDFKDAYSELVKARNEMTSDNNRLQILKANLNLAREQLLENLRLAIKREQLIVDGLQKEVNAIESRLVKLPVAEREYINIRREYQLNSDFYEYLLKKRAEASIAKASNISHVKILDHASRLRVSYAGQDQKRVFFIPVLLGLLIPSLFVFLLDYFNNKIVDKSDLVKVTSIPIIGAIGHNETDSNLVLFHNARSIISESFRNIRTNIGFLIKGEEKIVIMLSSSVSGEGKTFCSLNLAVTNAMFGKKTLLIGADLRKPKLHDDFKLSNKVGLSNYLIKAATLDEIIQHTDHKNLDIITSGPIPPNPPELLGSQMLDQLMLELKKIYDVIILDTPPLGLVTDALLLHKHVNVNLYIVRHRYTKKAYLEVINEYYEKKRIQNLGIIINDVKQRKLGYGGYYGYGYGYGYYGYGYKE